LKKETDKVRRTKDGRKQTKNKKKGRIYIRDEIGKKERINTMQKGEKEREKEGKIEYIRLKQRQNFKRIYLVDKPSMRIGGRKANFVSQISQLCQ
jgi:hypothetical protein